MVKKSWLLALSLALAFAFAFPANATRINFDDLNTGSQNWNYIPSSYKGFTWGDADNPWDVMNQTYYQGYDNTIDFPSSPNVGSPDSGSGTITSSTTFNFVGADFSTFAQGNEFDNSGFPDSAHSLTITGYRNGHLVGEVVVNLSTGFGSHVDLDNVDTLCFQPGGGLGWLMDNFDYCRVPLPSTLLLLGSGLVGLAGLGWRRRKAGI